MRLFHNLLIISILNIKNFSVDEYVSPPDEFKFAFEFAFESAFEFKNRLPSTELKTK